MASSNTRIAQSYRIKPLTIKTPLLPGESISSWLIRAALNQGCDPLGFTQFYWPEHRLWTYDVDKGFNNLDLKIHQDMAILAETEVEQFSLQNLTYFGELTNTLSKSQNINNTWVLPLSKRNRLSLLGYSYCPLCLADDEDSYLRLRWRHSWYAHCEHHNVRMLSNCSYCDMPYQPNMLEPTERYVNRCHHCKNKLKDHYLMNLLLVTNAYLFQVKAINVLNTGQATVFGEQVEVADWFEYMLFLINFSRKTARTDNPNYMFYRFMEELDIDIRSFSPDTPTLENSKTGLPFDYLSLNERIQFMSYANLLFEKSVDEWLIACDKVNASQNSFHLSKLKTVPKVFLPVYNQLPNNSRGKSKPKNSAINPRSPESVQKVWNRLQRKMQMRESYEQQQIRPLK